jgi:hypothetical protein
LYVPLEKRPLPKKPQDLMEHNCINLRMPTYGGLYAWEFEKGKRELKVRVDGQLVFNNVAEDVAQPHIAQGSLIRVLEDCSRDTTSITPAAASLHRRLTCWSRRCATEAKSRIEIPHRRRFRRLTCRCPACAGGAFPI